MSTSPDPVREQLARALEWEEAHVGFARSVDGIPPEKRIAHAAGFEHTLWQLLEHLRIALVDLADFATNPQYAHALKWPDDYWPTNLRPTEQQWHDSVAGYRDALATLQRIARDPSVDLAGAVPCGKKTQTYLRTILLAIDHNSYHLGQIVAVRRALGIWG